MQEEVYIVVFAVAVALILAATIGVWLYESGGSRTTALAKIAAELQLTFRADGFGPIRLPVGDFALFDRGGGGEMVNMMWGEFEGGKIAVFDLRYVARRGTKHQRTCSQTVMALSFDGLEVPRFEIRPENVLHKVGQLLGMQDIDFPTHGKFSSRFVLRGESEPEIRAFFTPALLEFFEGQPRYLVDGSQHCVILYRLHRRVRVRKVKSFLGMGARLFELMRQRA